MEPDARTDVDDRTGAEIEEEIGELSSELARTEPEPAAPAGAPEGKQRGPLDSPWLAAVLLLVALSLTIYNVASLGLFSDDRTSTLIDDSRDPPRETLLFAVEEVEIYRDEHGRLPRSLDDVGITEEFGVTYATVGSADYTLTATVGEETASYSSTEDPGAFFGAAWTLE